MVFTAKLLRGSPIWRLWRQHARVGGEVAGVVFRWVPGDDYVTEALDLNQINILRGISGLIMEGHGHGAAVSSPVDIPDEEEPEVTVTPAPTSPETVQDRPEVGLPGQHLSKRERRILRQQSGQLQA